MMKKEFLKKGILVVGVSMLTLGLFGCGNDNVAETTKANDNKGTYQSADDNGNASDDKDNGNASDDKDNGNASDEQGNVSNEQSSQQNNNADDNTGNEYWDFNEETGVLTVYSGFDVYYSDNAESGMPWDFDSSEIKKIVISEGIEKIGSRWFANIPNAESVEFPSTLKEIGTNAFWESGIIRVEIPEGVEKIETGAFSYMKRLEEISFPSTLKVIPSNCCQYDKALTVVNFKENLEEIETGAFIDSPIAELRLPESIKNVAPYVFDEANIGTYYGKKGSILEKMAKRNFRPFVEE